RHAGLDYAHRHAGLDPASSPLTQVDHGFPDQARDKLALRAVRDDSESGQGRLDHFHRHFNWKAIDPNC
ncbi:MAG: hypothetical protein SH820_04985, partial [Xanthomonadales bacterium]|nr:hypothetical protein [Xanthomonadales bacterium]